MSEIFKADYESRTESFVFPEVTPEKADQLVAAEKKVKDAVESFAKALDSISPGLTKELLDIFENLKQIWWVEETILWGISFRLLYERNSNKMPEKVKNILWEMLDNLTQYELVKKKSKSLEELLKACASINTSSDYKDISIKTGWRTFIPENLGSVKLD